MFRHSPLRALGAATILLSVTTVTAHAQAAPTPAPSSSPVTIVHVTTADRSDHTLKNTARTTYVVTAGQIKAEGLRTVGEALAGVPGVEISTYGAIGATTDYGIRGSTSAQVLVLVNGLPAPGTFSNNVNLSTFSTVGVKQIEIVEGGGSTLYGSGAIGGIINVITNDQRTPNSADVRYGSFGDREVSATADGFSVQRIAADNLFPVTSTADARFNADYEYSNLGYGYKMKLGKVDAAFNAGISSDNLGIPGNDYYPPLSTTSRERDVNAFGQLSFSMHGSQSLSTLELGGTRQQVTDACDYTTDYSIDPACSQPLPSLDLDSRVNLALRNAVTGDNEQLLYGIDLARGNARGDSGYYPTAATTAVPATATTPAVPAMPAVPEIATGAIAQAAAYAQESYSLQGGGHAYAGLRAERDGSFGGALSPSIGFIRPLSSDVTVKVNFASAFRAPNATELYFPGYGYPGLLPERAHVGDATLQDNSILGGANLTWFTNRTNDLIVAVPINPATNEIVLNPPPGSGYPFYPRNIDHALMQGFTFDIATKPYHHMFAKLNVTDLYEALDLDEQARLPNDPVIQSNVTLGFLGSPSGAFNDAAITELIAGARAPVDYAQPPYDQALPYANLGAYIRFRAAQHLMLTLRGSDLGNERYAQISGYPMPGRSFAIELSTR